MHTSLLFNRIQLSITVSDWIALSSVQLLTAGNPTEVEEVELLILSSQWAGMANVLQVLSEVPCNCGTEKYFPF